MRVSILRILQVFHQILIRPPIGVEVLASLMIIGDAIIRRLRPIEALLGAGQLRTLHGPAGGQVVEVGQGCGITGLYVIHRRLRHRDVGRISLDGVEISHLPMYRRARLGIGYLAQESSIFRGLTVEENIRAVLELTAGSRAKRDSKLRELLDEFSIAHLRHSPAVALSGGERRRVEIARALAANREAEDRDGKSRQHLYVGSRSHKKRSGPLRAGLEGQARAPRYLTPVSTISPTLTVLEPGLTTTGMCVSETHIS